MKILFYFVFLLFLVSCRKEATIWYSDWQVPLINDTLDLKNLTNDTTLSIQNGFYQIQMKRKLASLSPTELIKVPDTLIEQKFAIALPSLTIQPGSSFVNDNKDHIFDFKDAKLRKARIKSGQIVLEVLNPLATRTFFSIELPSVQNYNVTLKKELSVAAGTRENPSEAGTSIDLTGYWIEMTGTSGAGFNALPSKLKVNSDPDGVAINLTNLDSTQIKIEMKNLQFDYAQGYFGAHNIADTFNFESKLLKENVTGKIDLPELELRFDIDNSIKVPAKANIKEIKNFNSETNYTTNLSHFQIGSPFIIESPTGSWETLQTTHKSITFDETTSNIENFIENLGESTLINYELNLNPWGNISGGWDEFFPTSKIDVTASLNMPLQIGMKDLYLSDTFALNFVQDEEKTTVESGVLSFKIENGFPFQGEIELYFYDSLQQLVKSYTLNNKVESAQLGNLNNALVQTKKSNIDFVLPAELMDQLGTIRSLVLGIKLNSYNSVSLQTEKVNIPENAFVWVKVQSTIKLKNSIK